MDEDDLNVLLRGDRAGIAAKRAVLDERAARAPRGVLKVRVERAERLPNEHWTVPARPTGGVLAGAAAAAATTARRRRARDRPVQPVRARAARRRAHEDGIVRNTLNPSWADEEFSFPVVDASAQALRLVVKDHNLGRPNDELGHVELALDRLAERPLDEQALSLPLHGASALHGAGAGALHVVVRWAPFRDDDDGAGGGGAGGGGAGGGGDEAPTGPARRGPRRRSSRSRTRATARCSCASTRRTSRSCPAAPSSSSSRSTPASRARTAPRRRRRRRGRSRCSRARRRAGTRARERAVARARGRGAVAARARGRARRGVPDLVRVAALARVDDGGAALWQASEGSRDVGEAFTLCVPRPATDELRVRVFATDQIRGQREIGRGRVAVADRAIAAARRAQGAREARAGSAAPAVGARGRVAGRVRRRHGHRRRRA